MIDEQLRTLLSGAIRNVSDFDNWSRYLGGYFTSALTAQNSSDYFQGFIDTAYAGTTSGFKLVLQRLVPYAVTHGIDHLGPSMSDSIAILRKALDDATDIAGYAYKEEALQAFIKVADTLGTGSADKLSRFGYVSTGLTGDAATRRIDDMMKALSEIDLDAIGNLPPFSLDMKRVIADLSSNTNNIAKGAAFQVIAIKAAQRAGKTIRGVEVNKTISNIHGDPLRKRRYDYVEEIGGVVTNVEVKSWGNLGAVAERTRKLLKGTDEKGEQLLVDLIGKRMGLAGYGGSLIIRMQWIYLKIHLLMRSEMIKKFEVYCLSI